MTNECATCGQTTDNGFMIAPIARCMTGMPQWETCSPSCLVELAWKFKEAQDKLSKSKEVLNHE